MNPRYDQESYVNTFSICSVLYIDQVECPTIGKTFLFMQSINQSINQSLSIGRKNVPNLNICEKYVVALKLEKKKPLHFICYDALERELRKSP